MVEDAASPPSHGRGPHHEVPVAARDDTASRLLHGGVDRNFASGTLCPSMKSRLLHGGVDRNRCWFQVMPPIASRLLHGGVDRNLSDMGECPPIRTSPPSRGRGSKQSDGHWRQPHRFVASFTGAWIETVERPERRRATRGRLLHGGVHRHPL